jgi:hypothetical protein
MAVMPAGPLKRLGGAIKRSRPPGRTRTRRSLLLDPSRLGLRPATFATRSEHDVLPELDVGHIATRLPAYTALIGHPATATATLLAVLGAALERDSSGARTVLLDPCGMTIAEVAKLPNPRMIDVLGGEEATIPAAVHAMRNGVPDSTLLIDNARGLLDPDAPELGEYIAGLGDHRHRLIIRAEHPEDLPLVVRPQVVCLFALLPPVARDWESWCPKLAPVFAWHLRDGERLRGFGQVRGLADGELQQLHGTFRLAA